MTTEPNAGYKAPATPTTAVGTAPVAAAPGYLLRVNRGAAYLDVMLFRGTEDGQVLANDYKTGKRLWETTMADPVDAATGQKLWDQNLGGAIGSGIIPHTVNGVQKVAVAAGFISPAWPVSIRTSKVVILGLPNDVVARAVP
jgi:hypothetical protein